MASSSSDSEAEEIIRHPKKMTPNKIDRSKSTKRKLTHNTSFTKKRVRKEERLSSTSDSENSDSESGEEKGLPHDIKLSKRTAHQKNELRHPNDLTDSGSESSDDSESVDQKSTVKMEPPADASVNVNSSEESTDDEKVGSDSGDAASTSQGEDGLAALREELSNMPFQDLQKLKEKIGIKLYNKTMFSGSSAESMRRTKFKRENKNRPQEISSKRRPKFKEVIQVKKRVHRDPRFDDLSGEFNETYYNKLYGFLDDVKQREKEKLVNKYKKEHDPDKKQNMKNLIQKMSQHEQSKEAKLKNLKRENELKKRERELIKDGKTPFFLKKSEKKKLELAEKYRELKKSGKVDKYLSKKRKKTASKDRKKLPSVK